MRAWAVTEYGQPLQPLDRPLPELQGTEVLVKNLYAGVCHSDIHNWEGKFLLGGKKYFMKPKEMLPHTLGHEMEGELLAVGPDVQAGEVQVGRRYMVFPWIGCGHDAKCIACKVGDEQLCNLGRPKAFCDGASIYGGYASHVVVPHPKYLLDSSMAAGLPEGLGCVYMCSGLTAYSALKKVGPPPGGPGDLVILGCGGLGLQAIQFAKAMFGGVPRAADVSASARGEAEKMGCSVYDPSDQASVKQLVKDTGGGIFGVIDFVGGEATQKFAGSVTRRGSTTIIVGLFGGEITVQLFPMVIKASKLQASFVGSLKEAKEMFQIISAGKVEPIPHHFRPISEVSNALEELRAGKIAGRCILKHDTTVGAKL